MFQDIVLTYCVKILGCLTLLVNPNATHNGVSRRPSADFRLGNWGKWALDPINSPIFDGGEYSMSGNGVYEAHNCTNALPTGLNCIPPGQGGGCINSGPFKKQVLTFATLSAESH